jgi:ParB family chromosome partitioning protein
MSDETPFKRRPSGLGRGLSSLLGEVAQEAPVAGGARSGIQMLAVGSIEPHPDQPRRHFDDDALAELAESIGSRGLIQPIVVRPQGSNRFQIVAARALARRPEGAASRSTRHYPRFRRSGDAGSLYPREHPAAGPERDRRGRSL